MRNGVESCLPDLQRAAEMYETQVVTGKSLRSLGLAIQSVLRRSSPVLLSRSIPGRNRLQVSSELMKTRLSFKGCETPHEHLKNYLRSTPHEKVLNLIASPEDFETLRQAILDWIEDKESDLRISKR